MSCNFAEIARGQLRAAYDLLHPASFSEPSAFSTAQSCFELKIGVVFWKKSGVVTAKSFQASGDIFNGA